MTVNMTPSIKHQEPSGASAIWGHRRKKMGIKLLSVEQIVITLDHADFLALEIERRSSVGLPVANEIQQLRKFIVSEKSKLESRAILDLDEVFKPKEIA